MSINSEMIIKVMLVEDEPLLLMGLEKIVDWQQLGFYVCGKASNYNEAINIAADEIPDLVITDIMLGTGQKNGLDLVKKLKTTLPNTWFILVTGYDSFEFAQEAVEYNVKSYLLKPVTPEKLTENLMEFRKTFEARINSEVTFARQYTQLQNTKPFLYDLFISIGAGGEWDDLFGISGKEKFWQSVILTIPDKNSKEDIFSLYSNISNLMFMIDTSALIFIKGDKLLFVFRTEQNGNSLKTEEFIDAFFEYASFHEFPFTAVGAGTVVTSIAEIPLSTSQAETVCHYAVFYNNNDIVYYSDIKRQEFETPIHFSDSRSEIQLAIMAGDFEYSSNWIHQIMNRAAEQNASGGELRSLALEALSILDSCCTTIDISREESCFFSNLQQINDCHKLEAIISCLDHAVKTICDISIKIKEKQNNDAISLAKGIIDRDYAMMLSLESVAREVFLSPTYFSTLFSQRLGMNFKAYLTNVRIENAKRLLLQGDSKIYEIAEKVGYFDTRYFGQVFKKICGCTPLEYRHRIIPSEKQS